MALGYQQTQYVADLPLVRAEVGHVGHSADRAQLGDLGGHKGTVL